MVNPKYKMPAEWQRQSAIWVSWPHNLETWPDNLSAAQDEFVAFIKTVARYQSVHVMVGPSIRQRDNSRLNELEQLDAVNLIEIPTNDAWARDTAPTFVVDCENASLVAIDWFYNAWGGKYPPFEDDQQLATRVAEHLRIFRISPDLCFEGGAIEMDGTGVLLCTRSCALDPNRNPQKTQSQIEQIFSELLGARKTVWLHGDALEGDDTDGHIDQLARFTDDRTVVYAWVDDRKDPQFAGLERNLNELRAGLEDGNDADYRLIPLPLPAAMERFGRRVPASYCNFLICNGVVIVPQFGDGDGDRRAMDILRPLFPDRELIGLRSENLSVGLGSFHCLSQQQPEVASD